MDTGALAKAAGADEVSMATAKQVREITGQAIGGVAPVGHPARVRTGTDEALRTTRPSGRRRNPAHGDAVTLADLVTLTGGATSALPPTSPR